jgi:DNA (cytosine-5)-methyltransferase 1
MSEPQTLSSNGGRDLETVCGTLADLGYVGAWRVLDSQHFGLAQRRRRLFLLAVRDPAIGNPAEILALAESLAGYPEAISQGGPAAIASAGGRSKSRERVAFNVYPSTSGQHADLGARQTEVSQTLVASRNDRRTTVVEVFRKATKTHGIDEDDERWQSAEKANTLSTHGPQADALVLESGADLVAIPRRMTPVEHERLQGFPDDWTRYRTDGTEIANASRFVMLANAVSVPVAEWIGRRIVATL